MQHGNDFGRLRLIPSIFCNVLPSESFDVGSSLFWCADTSSEWSDSSLYIKVIGSRSRSHEQKSVSVYSVRVWRVNLVAKSFGFSSFITNRGIIPLGLSPLFFRQFLNKSHKRSWRQIGFESPVLCHCHCLQCLSVLRIPTVALQDTVVMICHGWGPHREPERVLSGVPSLLAAATDDDSVYVL